MTTSKTETMMHNKVCIHMTRMHHCFVSTVLIGNRVEALVSRHPRDSNKVFITGAGCLGECKNTEFVWGLRKTCFFLNRAVRLRVSVKRAFTAEKIFYVIVPC